MNFAFEAEKPTRDGLLFQSQLFIRRHGKKTVPNDVPEQVDLQAPLTPEGRDEAYREGMKLGLSRAKTAGSPRKRTRETILFLAHARALRGDETFEEAALKVGKPLVFRELDIPYSKDDPRYKYVNDLFEEGIYLKEIAHEADQVRRKGGEVGKTLYGIQARNIASLVSRHLALGREKISPIRKTPYKSRWGLGTHAGTAESFLAEIIRRTDGEARREEFLATLPNGFGYVKGPDVYVEILKLRGREPIPQITAEISRANTGGRYAFTKTFREDMVNAVIEDFQ